MTTLSRRAVGAFAVLIVALAGVVTWRSGRSTDSGPARITRGGALVSSIRSEPRTFNRYAGRDFTTEVVSLLTQAKLVRIDRVTQEVEPWLAESWTFSKDRLTCTLKLREGISFSDGAPFSSADVVFAFTAAYDHKTASPLGDALRVGGKPLQVEAVDRSTVVVRFPSPFGPGLRLLDALPILPRHRLQSALEQGTFATAWSATTPPSEIVGLGPFVLAEYQPGQRLVFTRNPRYWRRDATGEPLPYLDRLTLEIVPDQNAERLRLETGQIDFTQSEVRPEDYVSLKRAADAGRLRLHDLDVGLDADALWFNLKPEAKAGDPRRAWLQSTELRRAISRAVDRQAFADTVFLGAAVPVHGPITPGNRHWFSPDLPRDAYDPAEAGRLLASLRLVDRNGDGALEDPSGAPARFALLALKGNSAAERGAAVIREDLRKVGLGVDVVTLELGALVDRMLRGDYDALYFRPLATDTDPGLNLDYWLSSGGAHLWNMGQTRPATDWERQIDELMHRQVAALDPADRKRLMDQVQRIFAEQLPAIYFVAPRVYVAMSARVVNATPARLRPMVLWNADRLAVARPSRPTS